jgi:transcriptional regulator with XRE-family HTH domain
MTKDELQLALGMAIRRRRERLGMSQERFADSIRMHRAYYSALERGKKNVTLHLVWRVAEGLGVRIEVLMRSARL